MIPYGDLDIASLPAVDQADPTRTMQGADGVTLHTIAVDASGRLIMLPYGWDGATYRPLKVDDEGRMIGVMKGQADVKWGLRAWWKFIASEVTAIKDYSGYGHNGISYSGAAEAATYKDGVIGQAIDFDGSDDYVDCGIGYTFVTGYPFTLECWIAVSGNGVILSMYEDADNFVQLEFLSGDIGVYRSIGGESLRERTAGASIGDDTWTHIVTIINALNDVDVYINGVFFGQADTGHGFTDPPNAIGLNIGRNRRAAGFQYLNGTVDELRVYGRALSADEVSWRYANTNPLVGKPTRMIAVDNEGRMEVNIQDLPYKNTVMISDYVNDHAAGVVKIEFNPVPTCKLWVITNVICRCMLDDSGATSLYIRRGDDYHMIGEVMRATTYHTLNFNSHAYLKAGDIIACWFSAVDVNKSCQVYVNGYELDAP